MNIICDIGHPAQVNFFKHTVKKLVELGHKITIVCLIRGNLPKIIKKELGDCQVNYIGKHKGNKMSIIFEANIKKFFELLVFALQKKFDIGISVGSFNLGTVLKILGKPNLQFDDDPERKVNVFLEKLTSTELYFPPIIRSNSKVRTINALKEWAYLSPKYFTPELSELTRYNVRPHTYIFAREVSTRSLNYNTQSPDIISTFSKELPRTCSVLLSLENKAAVHKYPSHWILLKEPLDDIHSLMYFSKMVISSGDSIGREGALLGVPSIYCGSRNMRANKIMIDKGMLFHIKPYEVPDFVSKILKKEIPVEEQDMFRKRLLDEWDDVTEFIITQINKYTKQY